MKMIAPAFIATLMASSATCAFAQETGQGTKAPGVAAEGDPASPTDIIVTSQRRSESIQKVPISVSAFTAEDLERRNITKPLVLSQYVPNFIGQQNTGLASANAYYIRAIGNADTLTTFDPPVGTYVDDIYIARQNANNISLFDIERVEVLRGPQGTLFGRNTTGGAISVITRRPAKELGGYGEIAFGSFRKVEARGSIDIPLSDNLFTKFSGFYVDDAGYVKNTTTGEKLNGQHNFGIRGAVRFEPTSRISWDASVLYTRAEDANILNYRCDRRNPTNCDGRFAATGLYVNPPAGQQPLVNLGIDINPNGSTPVFVASTLANGKQDIPFGSVTKFALLSSNLKFDLGGASLNLITGYIAMDQSYLLDFLDGGNPPGVTGINLPVLGLRDGSFVYSTKIRTREFTQEIKLDGDLFDGLLSYVAGLYYFEERNQMDMGDLRGAAPGSAAALAGFGATITGDRLMRNNTFAYAGYAQADVHVNRQLTVTAGVRYTDEKKTITLVDQRDPRVTPVVGGVSQRLTTANLLANGFPTEQRTRLWTPRFAINYRPTDQIMAFASATNGFKSGGWVGRATTARAANDFGPENAWSYEIGLKTQLFDRRLSFNVTGYYVKVRDFQTNASVPVTGGVAFLTDNFADMENKGVEAEIIARPIAGLTLNATLGTQDAHFTNPVQSIVTQQAACRAQLAAGLVAGTTATQCANGIVSVTGDLAKPVRAPRLTYSLGASYDTPIAALHNARLQPSINATHTSSLETAAANLSLYVDDAGVINTAGRGRFVDGSTSLAHWMVNASVALESEDSKWRLSVSCLNCSNAYYTESAISFSYPNAPRTWEIRLKHVF